MIVVNNPEEILKAYSLWLRIDNSKFWAMGRQTKAFIEKHVAPIEGFQHIPGEIDTYCIPTSVTYPIYKLDAGVVLTKNTLWILLRNIPCQLGDIVTKYLKGKYPEVKIDRGLKHNSNDIYINGKKIFGEISFRRAENVYHACMINYNFTKEDMEDLLKGMSNDRNFTFDKIKSITGIQNEINTFDINDLIETLETHIFELSKIPEYCKY